MKKAYPHQRQSENTSNISKHSRPVEEAAQHTLPSGWWQLLLWKHRWNLPDRGGKRCQAGLAEYVTALSLGGGKDINSQELLKHRRGLQNVLAMSWLRYIFRAAWRNPQGSSSAMQEVSSSSNPCLQDRLVEENTPIPRHTEPWISPEGCRSTAMPNKCK